MFDNEIPPAHQRRGNVFWTFLQPVLGLQPERYPATTGELDWQLDAVARRDRRMAELNKAPGPPSIAAAIVAEVADVAKAVVRKVPALKRAIEFLSRVLDSGPVSEKEVSRLAALENLSEKTLKRARAKLKVKAMKKGRGGWFLSMTRAEEGQDS